MAVLWNKLVEQETNNAISVTQFWAGVRVWINRPHLVNRKLLATEVLYSSILSHYRQNLCLEFNQEDFQYFLCQFENNANECILTESCEKELNQYFNVVHEIVSVKNSLNEESKEDFIKKPVFYVRKLIPRNIVKFPEVLELVLIDESLNVAIFWPKESDVLNSAITPRFPYRIRYDGTKISIEAYKKIPDPEIKENVSEEWLKFSVLPKIIKWCSSSSPTTAIPSLNLVSAKSYSVKYNYLKEKYARKYIDIWPEVSDPQKYVYEDIAIAAYLLTVWEKEREYLNLISKQTFVDLGCGNGLLVDMLKSEGHDGIGIDVRRRKIWDMYENSASLIEKTVEPSDYNIFPEYDWIIGNHSDELTPWIPVIAARSSYKMRVFLLPCCPFTFNGKYERSFPGKTHYQSYLLFIQNLCESMGFVVDVDRLRIPSTRRTCFVCKSRNYEEGNEKDIDMKRKDFIECHSRKNELEPSISTDDCKNNIESKDIVLKDENTSGTTWINDFKPRERVEAVKNCSQLDREFLNSFVLNVATFLLQTENYISLVRGSETISWNAGGKIKLNELVSKIDCQKLKGLKNQNGGFQTFLRNHRNVFQIIDGCVQLNIPVKGIPLNSRPARQRKHRKTLYDFQSKPCFFFFNHPQGCPLEASDCNFSHKIS